MPAKKRAGSYLRSILALLIVFASISLVSGCASEKELVRPDYHKALKKWTRGTKVYDGLELKLHINATYKNREFRHAYLDRYTESYLLDEGYAGAMLDTEYELAELYNEFFFSIYTPYDSWNDFDRKDSVWKLYLVDSAGAQISPISIKRVDSADPLLREFFPYVGLWSSAYIARFPRYSDTGTEPIPGKDTEFIKLLVVGVLGNGELEWRLNGR